MTKQEYKNKLIWLQEIPKNWGVVPLWSVSRTKAVRSSEGELLSVYLDRGVIRASEGSLGTHAPSLDLSNYQLIEPGDFILNNQQAWRGSVGVSFERGIISPAYIVLTLSRQLEPRYANYLFRSKIAVDQFMLASQGVGSIQRQVHTPSLKNVLIIRPPLETQNQIADFLDEKTKIIDELVAKKEKLIELLREKRAALITRAVTKGLDPNAKLKPSGIDWLGDIPVGWEVERLKRVSKIDTTGVWGDEPELCENPTQVVSTPYVSSEGKIGGDLPLRCIPSKELKYYSCREGDLLVVKSSGSATNVVTGKAGFVTKEYEGVCFSNFLLRIRPRTILAKYLHYFLNSYSVKDRIRMMVSTTTYPNLKLYEYRGFEVPVPSAKEQQKIADFLDAETGRIDKAAMLIESQIEKLKEYRSSLIYSAVTGKIKI